MPLVTRIESNTHKTHAYFLLTRARPGGGGGYPHPPPLRFFADSEKTAARSVAKFVIAVQLTI